MGERHDRDVADIVEDDVDARLEQDDAGVFSKTEIMRTFRNSIQVRSRESKEDVLRLHRKGEITRRQFLKAIGFGTGGAVVAASGIGYFMGQRIFDERSVLPTGYAVMDVSQGDEIGSALNSQLSSRTELHIPEGTYRWDTDVEFSGSDADIIGDGNVVWERPSDGLRFKLVATGGILSFENVTIRGPAGGCDNEKLRFEAESEAAVRVVNVRQPDGTQASDSEVVGMYSPRNHAGLVQYIACETQNFGNNGLYASSMGKYTDGSSKHGAIEVIGGFYKNNNIANIRVGGDNFRVKDAVLIHDANAPERCEGGRRQRGIRIDGHGENGRIENVHITVDGVSNAPPLICSSNATGGSAQCKNICIRNENSEKAIDTSRAGSYSLSGDGLTLHGSGDLGHDGDWTNVCEGGDCAECETQEIQVGDIPVGSSRNGGGSSFGENSKSNSSC